MGNQGNKVGKKLPHRVIDWGLEWEGPSAYNDE